MKMLQPLFAIVFYHAVLVTVVFSITPLPSFASVDKPTLKILNWSEYLNPEIVEEFEQLYGVEVIEVYFETDDDRDNILLQTDGSGYDIAMVNGARLSTYQQQGWLAAISEKEVPNLKHIRLDKDKNHFENYSVPFTWGTLGIAYREDLVKQPLQSWMDLFVPQKSIQGKLVMIKGAKEMLGVSLKALNYPLNSMDKQALNHAAELLQRQKPYVKRYGYIGLTEEGDMVSGEVVASMAYNGDALALNEYNPNIKYVLPQEGGAIWVDHWAVFSSSNNKQLAFKFLNFINEPSRAARCAEFAYMAPANQSSLAFLSDDFRNNDIIFPSEKQLVKSEVLRPLTGRNLRLRSRIYNRIIN